MEKITAKSNHLVQAQLLNFKRSLSDKIDWNDRLISIVGARGTGKTTLLLQHIKEKYGVSNKAVYLSMDDIYFTENKLIDFIDRFVQFGGIALFIDEVHKYPDWAREIKNAYDFHQQLRIVFTGSSIIDMNRQNVDLSRRSVQYELTGLSFREYLNFTQVGNFPILKLSDLLENHVQISSEINAKIKPLIHFNEYLKNGYYPFFSENIATYPIKLEQVVRLIIENDLQFIEGFDPHNARKMHQLLYILAGNVPFKPNISKLSEKIGIHRNTLVQYIHYLEVAKLVNSLSSKGISVSILQKPEKLFLENTNLQHVLAPEAPNKGSLRESFFLNQLKNAGHQVALPLQGDFLIDQKYLFEIGGKDKSQQQIKGVNQAFIAADDIETGGFNKIPLWLFGLLY
jgi:predicted AAA+ superfamily ATPase